MTEKKVSKKTVVSKAVVKAVKKPAGFNIFSLTTNEDAEIGGVWHDYIEESRVLVARADNPEYSLELLVLHEKHREVIEKGGKPADKINREIYLTCMSNHILKGWEGFSDTDGEPMPYSVEQGSELLEKVSDFFKDINRLSHQVKYYREDRIAAAKEDLKKS